MDWNQFWVEIGKYIITNMDAFVYYGGFVTFVLGVLGISCLIVWLGFRSARKDEELMLRKRQMNLEEEKAEGIAKLVEHMDSLERQLSDARLSREIIEASEQSLEVAAEVIEEEQQQH